MLAQLLDLVLVGDFTSLHAAAEQGVDPGPGADPGRHRVPRRRALGATTLRRRADRQGQRAPARFCTRVPRPGARALSRRSCAPIVEALQHDPDPVPRDLRHRDRLQGRRPHPRRLRPQGDPARRARDAGPHGPARRVRRQPAPGGRPHHRLAAHDHPDRGADRDPRGARRRGALGELQHLLDPGPRRRRHRGRPRGHPRAAQGRAGLRLEGRDASTSTGGAPSRSCAGPTARAPT